jgi:hypothetical protein
MRRNDSLQLARVRNYADVVGASPQRFTGMAGSEADHYINLLESGVRPRIIGSAAVNLGASVPPAVQWRYLPKSSSRGHVYSFDYAMSHVWVYSHRSFCSGKHASRPTRYHCDLWKDYNLECSNIRRHLSGCDIGSNVDVTFRHGHPALCPLT